VNAYPQSADTGRIRSTDQGEAFTMSTLSLAIDLLKLPAFSQQITFAEAFPGQRLRRQPFAAFGPPCLQYRPAALGAHSFPKTVGAFAFDKAWLKCSLAHFLFPHW
jgi:hypothetical protein